MTVVTIMDELVESISDAVQNCREGVNTTLKRIPPVNHPRILKSIIILAS